MIKILLVLLCATAIFPQAFGALPQVVVKPLKKDWISDELLYPARVEANVQSKVLADAQGVVTRIAVRLGQEIRANQLLMEVKNPDPVYDYATSQVRSTIGGVVTEVLVSKGSRVSIGEPVAQVTNLSKLKAEIEIPAEDLPLLDLRAKGEFRLRKQKEPVEVRLDGLSRRVNPVTGTASGELRFATRPPKEVYPGMIGQVRFETNRRKGFLIPNSALRYDTQGTFVRIIRKDKAQEVRVEVERQIRSDYEITSESLVENDWVVVRANRYIKMGSVVEIQNRKELEAKAKPELEKSDEIDTTKKKS